MADFAEPSTWARRAVFVLLASIVTITQLVPLNLEPAGWAAPDLLLAMTCVWVARRPSYVPVYIVAAVFFATDLLFQRPPGLWAALVVLLSEAIRTRHRELRSMSFAAEWAFVALGLVTITLANRVVLAIVMTPLAPLGLTMMQLGGTVLIYPLVVFVAHYLLGVAYAAPGDMRKIGQRP
ncbi:rod shape-determining protein MreD [Yoonia vestfoldensis]|uniref:Rod shape-determining protein MreD n=1 Tax=Yoonia vestfoldensis TaxID=245188 RepID=A0A1Y0E908_9RHOB|nr:rod shape-determining protein MreD [Yoonia vestfoldensis]ART99908.1 rod shape-determining protein MreD [Yoonia vestfoldensis]